MVRIGTPLRVVGGQSRTGPHVKAEPISFPWQHLSKLVLHFVRELEGPNGGPSCGFVSQWDTASFPAHANGFPMSRERRERVWAMATLGPYERPAVLFEHHYHVSHFHPQIRQTSVLRLQLAEVAVPRELWAEMLATIAGLKAKAQAP